MSGMTDAQVQMLAHLACSSRPPGARKWDEPGVVAMIRKLLERGFGIREVIDRTLAHAWDSTALTPGTMLTPKARPVVESNPTVYPMRAGADEECPLHPGEHRATCRCCAANELAGDGQVRRDDPPAYDEQGHRLRHRPIRELVAEHLADLAPPTDTAEETPA